MSNLNLNKVILGGRLTADPELKRTQSGVAVTSFSIAVNRRFGEKQSDGTTKPITDFINIQAWRQQAEFVCSYFRKGSSICIVGSIQTRSWEDKNGEKRYATDVVADEVLFVDSKGESQTAGNASAPQGTAAQPQPQYETIEDDSDLPF